MCLMPIITRTQHEPSDNNMYVLDGCTISLLFTKCPLQYLTCFPLRQRQNRKNLLETTEQHMEDVHVHSPAYTKCVWGRGYPLKRPINQMLLLQTHTRGDWQSWKEQWRRRTLILAAAPIQVLWKLDLCSFLVSFHLSHKRTSFYPHAMCVEATRSQSWRKGLRETISQVGKWGQINTCWLYVVILSSCCSSVMWGYNYYPLLLLSIYIESHTSRKNTCLYPDNRLIGLKIKSKWLKVNGIIFSYFKSQ